MGDGYVMGTATEAGLPVKTTAQKVAFNQRLRRLGIPLKRCGQCGATKSRLMFSVAASKSDGLASMCKMCNTARLAKKREDAEYRNTQAEASKEYALARKDAPEYRAARSAINKAHRAKNAARPMLAGDDHLPKRCTTLAAGGCGKLKIRGEFHRDRTSSNQRNSWCIPCSRAKSASKTCRAMCRRAHGEPETTVCHLCGLGGVTNDNAHADHLVPRSKGGSDAATNLRWAHATCNISRGNKPLTPLQLARIYGEAA